MKEDKPDAWMPLYIGDWDGDTRHLDCEQDGAYGRLVRHYWRNGPLADDDAALARIVGMQVARWRKVRITVAQFFTVTDGRWNHKRVDAELIRWAQKKKAFVDRAAAGGRAKAAKSTASSTTKAVLKSCSSSSSTVEGTPKSVPSHSGQDDFLGPKEVRVAFCEAMGDGWCRNYIDPCAWQDVPERTLTPANGFALHKIATEGRAVLVAEKIALAERKATA